jgi:hypothetical protein
VQVGKGHDAIVKICELYFEKKKPYAYADMEWKDIRRDLKLVLKDMRDQTAAGIEFYDDGKRIVMIKKAAGKTKEKIIKGRLFKDTQKAFEKMKRGLGRIYSLDELDIARADSIMEKVKKGRSKLHSEKEMLEKLK